MWLFLPIKITPSFYDISRFTPAKGFALNFSILVGLCSSLILLAFYIKFASVGWCQSRYRERDMNYSGGSYSKDAPFGGVVNLIGGHETKYKHKTK